MATADIGALEVIERDAAADVWAAAPEATRRAFGVAHRRIGDGVLLMAPGLDGSIVFNRLLAYGIGGQSREDEVDDAIATFVRAGVKTWAVQATPGATGLAAIAAARGLVAQPRDWVKFARPPEPAPAAPSALAVRPAAASDAGVFGAAFCASYGVPELVGAWVAALIGRPGWRCFLAWDGATAAGTGALYLSGGLGWLGFGGTVPGQRGRGAQSAMLAARIIAGLAAGCAGFVTETGVPLPGEAAPSFRNIGRAGFRQAYPRPNLRPPA